jgi:signal transduction histidine kinase
MEAVGRLAGGVAHDFNNLLTAILGYADLLLDRLPPDDRSRPAVIEIHKAGQNAASLTRNLLAFSRKQVLEPIILNLNDVIETTESLLARLVGEDVEITLDLDPTLQLVRADPGQVSQVLLNLAVNARDAMPGGGQLVMTSYNADASDLPRPAAPGLHVVLTVQDTGCGMTEPVLAHIFEPFFTTKGVGAGTGLGLATVYGIVEQSGGKIWVDSTPGVGTTFTVCLPAATANEIGRPDGDRGLARTGGSETILLVEDNDAVRALAREALTGDGYDVVEATNGREALSAIEGRVDRIALVVTDVVMPVMGGRELVDRLRAARPEIKVIFTSGYASDPHTPQHARDSGAGFLQKPFAPTTVRRSVRELLDATTEAGCPEPV